jgi:hypothetical protein
MACSPPYISKLSIWPTHYLSFIPYLIFSAMYVCTVCQVIPTKASDTCYQSTTLKGHEEYIDFQQPLNNQHHSQPQTPLPGPQV